MKIRVIGHRWDAHAAAHIQKLCDTYNLPFLDRGQGTDPSCFVNGTMLVGPHTELPDGYVFFTHKSLADLPCTHQSQVQYPVEETRAENKTPEKATRKIVTGTKRLRAEWKELQAKCKSSTSFNEWLTSLHDLLLVPMYTVARIEEGDTRIAWSQSLERGKFIYPTSTLDAMPKVVVEDLELHLASFRTNNRDPFVCKTEKPLNGRDRAVLIDALLIDDTHGDGEQDLWLLTIKPVTISNGLY